MADTAMSTCTLCGDEVPRSSMLGHYSEIHPKERAQAFKRAIEKRHDEDSSGNDRPDGKDRTKELKDPTPTGIKEKSDLRSRMVPLRLYSDTVYIDTSVVIL